MAETTKINVDLSPESVLKAVKDMGDEVKKLAATIEESLGKKAVSNVDKLTAASETGSTKIGGFFRNMGQRLREDLRTAFDATGIIAGGKLAREIGEGVRSVFDMEKAFDRLNTRMQLTGRAFLDFKKNVGGAVAGTGQRLEEVLPGVETMAARGNVTNPAQLQQMAGMLAQVRATTGEEVSGLADTVVTILRDQQKEVNAANVRAVIDTLQSTRVRGSFQTAQEAGQAVSAIAPYATQLRMGTQEMGGLAAVASRAGQGGQNILQQFVQRATVPGGQEALNQLLGQEIFQNGRINPEAIGRVNVNRFGGYSQQALEAATGLTGASGADLARFVDAFKNGMGNFKQVIQSTGETQRQFDMATDNLATSISKFKNRTIEASRAIGSGLSSAANALMKGDISGVGHGLASSHRQLWGNVGTLAGAGALSVGAGMLLGGGLNSLLRKSPQLRDVAVRTGGALAGGAAAEAMGAQKVYVVNASEIAQGVGAVSGLGASFGQNLGKLEKMGLLTGTAYLAGSAGNALANTEAGSQAFESMFGNMTDALFKTFNVGGVSDAEKALQEAKERSTARYGGMDLSTEAIARAVKEGTSEATVKINMPLTNPSSVKGTGSIR